MNVYRMALGVYAANCYIVTSSDNSESVVVDPGGDIDEILKVVNKLKTTVKSIVLTHGHGDHIGGVVKLKEKLDVPVMVHKDELDMVKSSALNMSSSMMTGEAYFDPDILLTEGDQIWIGDESLEVIHTPGHTFGGICLKGDKFLITGDTLFKGSIGRTDLYGGDYESLLFNIKTKLLALDDDIIVYPGHGSESTIGYEKNNNPFLKK